jgi:hypothetical protein
VKLTFLALLCSAAFAQTVIPTCPPGFLLRSVGSAYQCEMPAQEKPQAVPVAPPSPTPPASPATAPSNYWGAVGGTYGTSASPKFGGIASVGYRIAGDANKMGATQSYTTATFTTFNPKAFVNSSATSSTVSMRSGIATQVAVAGTLQGEPLLRIWTLADLGGANNAKGGISGAFSDGGVAVFKLPFWGMYLAVDGRIVKTGANSAAVIALLIGKRI